MSKRIILVKGDPLENSPRLVKLREALEQNGYDVTILCWNRDCSVRQNENIKVTDYQECDKIVELKLRGTYGVRSLPYLFIWWFFEFVALIKLKWDIVHVVNFYSLPPAVVIAKLLRKHLVYEVLDGAYIDMIHVPNIVRIILIGFERILMYFSDAVIIVDELQVEEFRGIPNRRVVVIYDSPPDIRRKIDVVREDGGFILFYAGVFNKARKLNLDKIIEAVKDIEGVRLVIAGYGDMVEEIKDWCRIAPRAIRFIGRISYERVLEESLKADLLFVLRDPVVPSNKYICGSKFLEALMCGKPVLVNKGTSTAIKVSQENCGLIVDANNVEEVKEAIIKLRSNSALRQKLGANARKAYQQKYGWHIMEQRLLALYRGLLEKEN